MGAGMCGQQPERASGLLSYDATMAIAPLTDRELSATLADDYEALQEHVQRVHMLAVDLQQQSPGRSNEVAVLSDLLSKAQKDLKRLKGSIARLRQERHRLANEAMRALALDRRLTEMTIERDRLRAEGAAMRQGLIASAEESARRKRETDQQLARMALELGSLRRNAGLPILPAPAPADDSAQMQGTLVQILSTLDRLVARLEPGPSAQPAATPAPTPTEPESIAIDFEH